MMCKPLLFCDHCQRYFPTDSDNPICPRCSNFVWHQSTLVHLAPEPPRPILSGSVVAELCERCGHCCIAEYGDQMLGGTPETDAWLRMPNGECRFLLPPNSLDQRLCAIHTLTVIDGRDGHGFGINPRPLRPRLCRESPTRRNLDSLPDCPVTRAAKEMVVCAPASAKD